MDMSPKNIDSKDVDDSNCSQQIFRLYLETGVTRTCFQSVDVLNNFVNELKTVAISI